MCCGTSCCNHVRAVIFSEQASNSVKQNSFLEAIHDLASQEILHLFWNMNVCCCRLSPEPFTGPYLEPDEPGPHPHTTH